MTRLVGPLHIMAIDSCEHILSALSNLPNSRLTHVLSKHATAISTRKEDIDLIVIGVSRYPVRRLFISELRRVYPDVPLMVFRREIVSPGMAEEVIRAEFILSDQGGDQDCEIVNALRPMLPMPPCVHLHRAYNYDIVREVIRVIAEQYPDPTLDLTQVAAKLPISPNHLSRILNKQVGVSFRQLLRHVRIEEAKRMLASKRFSVKEVAARVGFSDSHYFSRSFKELTGLSATEYRGREPLVA